MMIQLCFNWYTVLTYIKCFFFYIIIWQSIGGKKTNAIHFGGQGKTFKCMFEKNVVQTESKS